MIESNSEELTEEQFQREIDRIKELFSLQVEITLEKSLSKYNYEVYWDEENRCYRVRYGERKIDYGLLHEIGHILLAEITGYRPFASLIISRVYTILYPETEVIPDYANKLIDCFVNHHIFSAMNLYYPFLRDVIDWALDQPFPERNIHEHIAIFLIFYLDCQYNLRTEDKPPRLQKITVCLGRLETLIMEQSQIDFQHLKSKLDQFQSIKATKKASEILQFMYGILNSLSLWKSEVLREFFDHIFPESGHQRGIPSA